MGRTRKTDKHLPQRMYLVHGSYWYRPRGRGSVNLGRDYAKALTRYAALIDNAAPGTIAALITRYEDSVLIRRAPETQKGRKKEFKNIRKVFGKMDPRELKAADAWTHFELRGLGQAGLHEIRALSVVLSWGVKWGALDINPLLRVQWAEGEKFAPRTRYVTDEEFIHARSHQTPMIQFAMNIALITAARQQQIRLMDRKQIAAGQWKVVQSKGGKKMDFLVAGSLEENISAALAMSPQVRQYVIVNRQGKPYTLGGFQTQWKRGMIAAFPSKADRFTFHDIRAKSVSDAKTLEEGRQRAGHSDSRITQKVYRRLPDSAPVMDIAHLKARK